MLSVVIIIILLIIMYNLNEKNIHYKVELEKLKRTVKNLEEKIKSLESSNNNEEIFEIVENDTKTDIIESKLKNDFGTEIKNESEKESLNTKTVKTKEQIKKEELERKNTTILATGALLIVLSAIVFLTSTWSILTNGFKTVSLFLFIGLFLGASKLSKEKYKLENTSKTFFYIAMAYIPICLISISFFGLLGNYLSINGDGRYIYLFIIFLITAITYNYFYKKQNNYILFYGSIVSQITSLVMFSLIFSNNLSTIITVFLLYNICLILFNKIKQDSFIDILIILIWGISIIYSLFNFFNSEIYIFISYLLIIINSIFIYKNTINTQIKLIAKCLFILFLYILGFYLSFVVFEKTQMSLQFLFSILYFIIIYICIKVSNINDYSITGMTHIIAIGILYILSFNYNLGYIKPYMIAILEEIFLYIEYNRNNKIKIVYSFIIPINLVLVFIGIIKNYNAINESYFVMSIIFMFIGEIYRNTKNKDLNNSFLIVTNILLPTTFIYNMVLKDYSIKYVLIYKIIFLLVYLYYLTITKEHIFKYLAYLIIGYLFAIDFQIPNIGNIGFLSPTILTIVVILLEYYIKKLQDSYSDIFIICLEIVSFITLFLIKAVIRIPIAFVFTIILYIWSILKDNDKIIKYFSIIGLAIILFLSELDLDIINIWKTIYVIVISFLILPKKKFSIETGLSGIVLLSILYSFGKDDMIINSIIFMIWSLYNTAFSKNSKEMDFFKSLLYFSGLSLYFSVIKELSIFEWYKSIYFIGTTVFVIIELKTIIQKYLDKENLDVLEFIVFPAIYLYSMMNYYDELDGIVFVLFLTLLTVFSYFGKDGKIFLTSIIAITINAIALTREFWALLPWWVYLMILGIGLLTFAITNESRSNKRNEKEGNIVNKIKDYIEKE